MRHNTFKYVAHLLESDTSVINNDTLLNKVQALESGSEQSTRDFTNYIRDNYDISDKISFKYIVKMLLKDVVVVGSGYGIIKAINKAVEFGYNTINYAPFTGTIEVGSKIVFFSGEPLWWLMPCFLACFIVIFLYKIFIWALKKPVTENYSPTDTKIINLYNELTFKKSIIQTNRLLNKFKIITESTDIEKDDNSKALVLRNVIYEATLKCKTMLNKIIYVTHDFLHKYRKFVAVMLICIGLILSFNNLQKNISKRYTMGNIARTVGNGLIGVPPYNCLHQSYPKSKGFSSLGYITGNRKSIESVYFKFIAWLGTHY